MVPPPRASRLTWVVRLVSSTSRRVGPSSEGCRHERSCGGRGPGSTRTRSYNAAGGRGRGPHGRGARIDTMPTWINPSTVTTGSVSPSPNCRSAPPTTGRSGRSAVRSCCSAGRSVTTPTGARGSSTSPTRPTRSRWCPGSPRSAPSCVAVGPTPARGAAASARPARDRRVVGGRRRVGAAPGRGVRGGAVRDRRAQGVGADLEARGVGRRRRLGHRCPRRPRRAIGGSSE